ncbi:phosphotransferase [Caballeronia novacaledonica]|uniref:Phosphotransferase n=1 Tax=Caballeronia novacaledonica TaxID=1544861 RepID=A0ACB5R316_9BURK|nr:phosphotransferase [Caballeronia novacaledonica]
MMTDSFEALRLAMAEEQLTSTLRLRLARAVEIKLIGGTVGRTTVYRVNSDELVAKVFHHAPQIKQRRELTAYAFLSTADLPIARLLDSGILPCGAPWILLSCLRGTPVSEIKKRAPDVVAQMSDVMAGTLASLHRLPADASLLFVREHALSVLLQERIAKYARFATWAAEADLPERSLFQAAWSLMQRLRLDDRAGWARKGVFVHGDFSTRNLLAESTDGDIEMTGLLDFERARLGDPAEDLCATYLEDFCWNDRGWAHFLEAYRQRSSEDRGLGLRFVYFFIGHVCEIATWAPGKDDAYYQAGLRALEALLEDHVLLRALPASRA